MCWTDIWRICFFRSVCTPKPSKARSEWKRSARVGSVCFPPRQSHPSSFHHVHSAYISGTFLISGYVCSINAFFSIRWVLSDASVFTDWVCVFLWDECRLYQWIMVQRATHLIPPPSGRGRAVCTSSSSNSPNIELSHFKPECFTKSDCLSNWPGISGGCRLEWCDLVAFKGMTYSV